MRKLASIQRITNIAPIPGADNIVRADVLGWSVVVGKDEFKVGDLAVYFEIDSWLDASIPAFNKPVFQPRFTNWGTKHGMRLKTIKLRKQISQGLLMPVYEFVELVAQNLNKRLAEGDDVTEILKIEKWESIEDENYTTKPGKSAGAKMFPSFIRKTDQERVQNYVGELMKYLDTTFEVSIKLDGSSMTVFHVDKSSPHFAHVMEDMDKRAMKRMSKIQKLTHKVKKWLGFNKQPDYIVGVCSRNIELPLDGDNHFSAYVREHGLTEKLRNYCASRGASVAIQGELLAPSIQQNHEKVDGFEFFVYDAFDIDKQQYFCPGATRLISALVELPTVPIVDAEFSLRSLLTGNPEETPRDLVEAILAKAEGPGMKQGVKREGLVYKDNNSEWSFKAISNSFLLKKEGK